MAKKASVREIVDPMLKTGKYTRAEICAEILKARPDYKDPSAAVSDGMIRLRDSGTEWSMKDTPRKPRAERREAIVMGPKGHMARFVVQMEQLRGLMHAGFQRREEEMQKINSMPKAKRIWA